jgi:hypothetical protein
MVRKPKNSKPKNSKTKNSKTKNSKTKTYDIFDKIKAGMFIFFLIIGILSFLYSMYLFIVKHFYKDDDYSIYKSKNDCEKAKPLSIFTKPIWLNNECNADTNPLTDPFFVIHVSLFCFLLCGALSGALTPFFLL